MTIRRRRPTFVVAIMTVLLLWLIIAFPAIEHGGRNVKTLLPSCDRKRRQVDPPNYEAVYTGVP